MLWIRPLSSTIPARDIASYPPFKEGDAVPVLSTAAKRPAHHPFYSESVIVAIQSISRRGQEPARSWVGAAPLRLSSTSRCGSGRQGEGSNPSRIPGAGFEQRPAGQIEPECHCSRQCQRPRGHKTEGEQVVMSQGGSAPRPASRHSSPPPARETDTASSSFQRGRTHQEDSRARPPHELGSAAVTEGDGRGQQPGSMTADLPGMPISDHLRLHRHLFEESRCHREQSLARQRPPAMGTDRTPAAATAQPTNPNIPPTTSPAGQPMHAGRATPPDPHPYPLAARRILTPKSPISTSLSRAALRTVDVRHLTTSLPGLPPMGDAISAYDIQTLGSGSSSLGASAQFYSSAPGHGTIAPSPTRPTSGLSRSLSHPSLSHSLPSVDHREPLQSGGVKRKHSARPDIPEPLLEASFMANRAFNTRAPVGDGRWGGPGNLAPLPAGTAVGRNLQITEGQTVLTITPNSGEEFYIPVDVHQASKQADEKRQRNAQASSRFRLRKKDREKEQQETLQRLEPQVRELEKRNEECARRCQELEADRDFYRNERNRLRDIVSRTPSIKEWVDRGPPSPSPRSGGSFASGGNALHLPPQPQPQVHAQPQPHPMQYPPQLAHPHPRSISVADQSLLGPPARRRRTDSEPQLPSSSYNLTTPTPLPPIVGPSPPTFSIPSSPHITPPLGFARLPPLRFEQSRTPSTTPPPVPSGPPPPSIPPPSTGQYPTFRTYSYESGWATDTRGQPEGGPR